MPDMRKTIIIVGFPGIGKTEFTNIYTNLTEGKLNILDLNVYDYEKESEWPANYIHIVQDAYASNEYDYILVDIVPELRRAMQQRKIPYLIVAPYLYGLEDDDQNIGILNARLKNEYKMRWFNQGRSLDFIRDTAAHWAMILRNLDKDQAPKIWLFESFSTLRDIFENHDHFEI